jgi:hypothetical protein
MGAICCQKHGGDVAAFVSPNVRGAAMHSRLNISQIVQITLHLDSDLKAGTYVDFDFYKDYVRLHEDISSLYQVTNSNQALEIFDKLVPCCKICLKDFLTSICMI